ncbi:MAG: hypothetical protein KGZ59_06060 [Chitinophagaceae bacterium]|nr:hypothetical protein [Chitinophagaceae bacterium]
MKMKNPLKNIILILLFTGLSFNETIAQDEAPKSNPIISIKYFVAANQLPYLEVNTQTKTGRKLDPLPNIPIKLYFGEEIEENFMGSTKTGQFGKGKIYLPEVFKAKWDSLDELVFTTVSDSLEISGEVVVKKAALFIDTLNDDGLRFVKAILKEKQGINWVPVGEVDMKLRIKRLTGNLSIGEDETYTSDTSGYAIAEFKRDTIPGDEKGNIILLARVEDNDTYGNLEVAIPVNWGKATTIQNGFWHRSLWATGDRAPIWLLLLALGLIIGIWGTIFYLIFQMIKIKKLNI